MDNFDLKKYLAEGRLLKENKYDIDDPNSPLGQLNDNDQDVAILNNMTKKYGLDVVLMWMSSGEYGDREYFEEGRLYENPQDHSDEEELDLHPDYDKGGKYYSEEGAKAFRIQPFKKNDIKYTKHEANRMGRYIVGLEGEELKKFISDYMAAWEADKGDTPEGRTFKENKDYKNDYANSEEDYTDEMVVEKIKDIIKYHELDPQDLIDEIRIEFGIDAMD